VRRFAIAIIGATLLIGLAGGVARAATSPSASPDGGKVVLRIGTTQDVDNLNPFTGYSTSAYEVYHLNYDLLVGYRASDGAPQPELADSWTSTPDGLEWTFKLHPGVTWQDGVALTAKDVAFTYNYIIQNQLAAYTSYTNNIKKAVAVDDATVKFILTKPKANMLRLWIPIVPEHVWSKVPGKNAGNDYQNSPPIVGSGPFQVVEAKKGEYTRLVANKSYWKGAPHIDEVLIEVYTNQDTMTMDLKSGAIDVAYGVPVAQFNALKSESGIKAVAAQFRYFDQITMNVYNSPNSLGNPVLKDEKFRQAISWAVDKQKIVQTCFGGYAQVGQSILTPTVDYAWTPAADMTFGYDLEKAKQMLDAAGYADTNGDGWRDYKGKKITLRLWTRSESPEQQRAGKLVTGSFESIGIDIQLAVMNDGSISDGLYNYKGNTYAPDFDMFIWGWGGYADPDYMLGVETTSQIEMWNDSLYSNAAYDTLYQQQSSEMDAATRKAEVQQMQQMFYQAAPYVVLCYPKALIAYNTTKWTGWVPYPAKDGLVVMSTDNIDSYLNLRLQSAQKAAGGSSTTTTVVIVVIVVVIVAAIVALLVRRGRGRAVEE
jgi:peptide/nickel transport system substrate-binding protein